MHQEPQQIFNFSITIREVIVNTLLATGCGAIISFFYVITFNGVSYSVNLIKSIVMLSMITAFVMMVIGDNLAQAFGMVGIMSIIQFRSAMRGAQDFMFLFFALAIGLACGEGLYSVALVGCFLIGLITLSMSQVLVKTRQQNYTLTVVRTASSGAEHTYSGLIQSFCTRYRLVSTKASMKANESFIRLTYLVRMKNSGHSEVFVHSLKDADGVVEVNLLFDEEE